MIQNVSRLFARQNLHDIPTQRLNDLSADERSKAMYDVHGVSGSLEETPDLLQERLHQMEETLSQMPQTDAYRLALEQNVEYVESLRLRFLRSENLVPDLAAKRIIKHFEAKQRLFGKASLGKELEFSDLSPEEQENFRLGYLQLLPSRDRRGRAIILIHGPTQLNYPMEGTVSLSIHIINDCTLHPPYCHAVERLRSKCSS